MDGAAAAAASEMPILHRSIFTKKSYPSYLVLRNPLLKLSLRFSPRRLSCTTCSTPPYNSPITFFNSSKRSPFRLISVKTSSLNDGTDNSMRAVSSEEVVTGRGLVIAAAAIRIVLIFSGRKALAVEGVASVGYGIWERSLLALRSSLPKVLQVLTVLREQGLILGALLGLSAFFSMAETSITTLWPWK
ncbi:hypothetical protein OROMI_026227 [Orobanche minor]